MMHACMYIRIFSDQVDERNNGLSMLEEEELKADFKKVSRQQKCSESVYSGADILEMVFRPSLKNLTSNSIIRHKGSKVKSIVSFF
jgi:hypothetical protein